jgi:hypothetical protein
VMTFTQPDPIIALVNGELAVCKVQRGTPIVPDVMPALAITLPSGDTVHIDVDVLDGHIEALWHDCGHPTLADYLALIPRFVARQLTPRRPPTQ